MNDKFYFYVCNGEFNGFYGDSRKFPRGTKVILYKYVLENKGEFKRISFDASNTNHIKTRIIRIFESLLSFFQSSLLNRKMTTVKVIIIDGENEFVEKDKIWEYYSNHQQDYSTLSELMCQYFKKLTEIAQEVYNKEKLGIWRPKCVTVITHWGGQGVDDREQALIKAVASISIDNKQFKKWITVASSSTRQEAFPTGYNPFVSKVNPAKLPTADVCKILERTLPLAGYINWDDVRETTGEAELKRYYDRLMLKLNH